MTGLSMPVMKMMKILVFCLERSKGTEHWLKARSSGLNTYINHFQAVCSWEIYSLNLRFLIWKMGAVIAVIGPL